MITRTCALGLGELIDPKDVAVPLALQGCTSLDAPVQEILFCILILSFCGREITLTGEYQSPPLPSPGDLERARRREER